MLRLPITSSASVKPMKLACNVELAGTDNLKTPLSSVLVPFVVPLIVIDTPGSGLPSSFDVTFPVTTVCAFPQKEAKRKKARQRNS